MRSRIYRVTEIATNKVRIIEATSVAHAMKHVAETTHTCVVCNGIGAVKLIADGVKFESAVKNAAYAKSQATDAALSRQVACTDGLGAVSPAPTFGETK